MSDKEYLRYVILNTTTAPATVQCKIERMAANRNLLNLEDIEKMTDESPISFEQAMKICGEDVNE